MVKLDKASLVLAAGLSILAGYVDAIGLRLVLGSEVFGDLQMALTDGFQIVVLIVALLGIFVVGVAVGSLAGRSVSRKSRFAVLVVVTLLLVAAAGLNVAQLPLAAVFGVVLAVGASNSVFQREGNIHVGLLFLLPTLVRLGEGISAAAADGKRNAWVGPLLMFMTTLTGAAIGWMAQFELGALAFWVAAGAAAALSVVSIVASGKGPPVGASSSPMA